MPQQEAYKLAEWRYEALHGDRTHLADIIAALHNRHTEYVVTALQAIAQLNAVEALPDIEAVMQAYPAASYYHAHSRHARCSSARLRAGSPGTLTSRKRYDFKRGTQNRSLPEELGIKKEDLRRVEPVHAEGVETVKRLASPPPKSQVVRELADIVYRSHYAAYKTSPQLAGVDFSADSGVLVKMRFALVSREQRTAKLIDTIAASKVYGLEGRYMVQLAIDEGLPASRAAAAAKIREMDKQRDRYAFAGFRMLFDMLHGVGDKTQAPFINTFLHKPNSDFAWGISADVAAGRKVQFVPGY